MAQWINYTALFPVAERAVIQKIIDIADSEFSYSQFESFRFNFNDIPFDDFITETYADSFFSSLASWLGDEADSSSDWENFKTRFDTKDHTYINLIIAAYSENSVADFANEENSSRISNIKAITGFMNAYKTTLSDYMNELPFPIIITVQPTSVTICEGEAASVSVTATGSSISYQWKQNGSNITGANSSTLLFNETVAENQGTYECVLSSDDGYVVTTTSATITVDEIVTITEQPCSKEIDWNTNNTITVGATSDTTIQYQWRKNGVAISGETSASLALLSVTTKDSAAYDCILTDGCSQIISAKANISVVSFSSEIYTVEGTVENKGEAPLSGITVKAVDRKPGTSKVLGTTTTDYKGFYKIEYLKSELLNQESFTLNLVVQLFEDGSTEPSDSSILIEEATANEEIDFSTDAFIETQTEFDLVSTYINATLDVSVILSELDAEDIKLLANKTFSEEVISCYINASELNTQISTVSVEQFYGIIKLGLPTSAEALSTSTDNEIKEALLSASDQSIISTIDAEAAQVIADAINGEAATITEQSESNPFKSTFEKVTLTTAQKTKIVEASLNDPTESNDIWQELIDDPTSGLTEPEVTEVKRVISIQDIDRTNDYILNVLDNKVGDPSVETQLDELADFSVSDWEALIDDTDGDLLSIPDRFTGNDTEKKTAYAQELRDKIETTIPTKVLTSRMSADVSFDSTNIEEFFTINPDFEIGKEQIAKYLDTNPLIQADFTNSTDDVQGQLEAVQRLYHLGPEVNRFETLKPLLDDNLTSASKITTMGATDFVATYGGTIGSDVAKDLYDKSAQTYGRVLHAVATHTNTTTPLALGDIGVDNSSNIPGIPDLESLFGSLDYCECTHCRSVYSPAAYLVDLLNFIDHPAPVQGQPAPSYNLREKLLERRSEIKKLFLNCDNTNTPLPYIDIINEILENYIHENYLSGTAFEYQTETDSETLRATAQNVITDVYESELKSANYPHQLPFNLWFEQAKVYLKKSNVELGELTLAAPKGNLTEQRHQAIAAASSLGIPVQQLDIINGTSSLTAATLYNVSDIADLINPVSTFIEKASITYEELTELIESKYINPLKKFIYFPQDGSCNLDLMTIGDNPDYTTPDPVSGFNEAELLKLNHFIRLKKLTGWSTKDLDLAINTVGNGVLNDNTIINLHLLQVLKNKFNTPIEEMVTWWNKFDVSTFIDDTLFDKLFQDDAVNYESGVIPTLEEMPSFVSRTFDEASIKPLVLGALNLSAYELDYVLDQGDISNDATVDNFSYLYRLSSFTHSVGISIEDYFEKRTLSGIEAIESTTPVSPQNTINFLKMLDTLSTTAFTEDEIAYLKSGDNTNTLAPQESDITTFLSQLRSDYQSLGIEFSEVAVDLEVETSALMNAFVPEQGILNDVISGTTSAANPDPLIQTEVENYFSTTFSGIVSSSEELDTFKAELDAVPGPVEDQIVGRKRLVYKFLQRYNHVNTDFRTATAEKLSLFFNLQADLINVLFEMNTAVSNVKFGQILFDLEFLMNNDTIDTSSYPNIFRAVRLAAKAGVIAKGLNASTEELDYIITQLPDSYTTVYEFPVENETDISYSDLEVYLTFRNLDQTFFIKEHSLIDYLKEQDAGNRFSLLASATGWRESDITELCGTNGFNFEATPSVYDEVDWINQLAMLFPLMAKAKVDASSLLALNLIDPDADTAYTLRNLLSSGMNKKQWIKVATEMHDVLREKQRDAMVAFLVATDTEFSSITDVYDYFLIDTQMSACQLTSRIKQSISAIQLFVQRIGLGFEGDLKLSVDKMEEWNWRKNYRVWEANRKVFLYPENYLLPELRSTKSKLYEEFDEALAQEEVSSKVAENAYLSYLEGFKEVTSLTICQTAYDKDRDLLYAFATNQNDTKEYFYRTLKSRSIWSAWEKIPIDIKGAILPTFNNGELMICWLDKKVDNQRPPQSDLTVSTSGSSISAPAEKPSMVRLRMAWTTKTIEGWQTKKLSDDSTLLQEKKADEIVMIPMIDEFETFHISMCTYRTHKKYFATTASLYLDNVWGVKLVNNNFIEAEKNKNIGILNTVYVNKFIESTELQNGTEQINGLPFFIGSWGFIRRALNFGIFSRVYSGLYGSPQGTPSKQFKIKDQKLTLENPLRYRHIESAQIVNVNSNGVPKKQLRFMGTSLISHFGNRSLTIIKDVGQHFPFLYKDGPFDNHKDTTPYFIQDQEKTFIIYPELSTDSTSMTFDPYDVTSYQTFDQEF